MPSTQETRPIAVASPLGEDVLLLRSMSASEQLGRPFEFSLELLSADEQIKMEDLLGQNMTVRLQVNEEEIRYFNGFVGAFAQVGTHGRFAAYRATLHPWLWFLTRTADCRIFQEMTVPDIINQILRENGFTELDDKLSGSYRTWEYCVQYRETDFNFISRLMEQEGIYYFFTHEAGKHTLVLSDAYSSHTATSGYEQVPYFPPDEAAQRERDHLDEWTIIKRIQPGCYALDEFDFKRPKAGLAVKSVMSREHAASEFEVYDYPGQYVESGDGDSYARIRLEELQACHELLEGSGNARGLSTGGLFELTGYPREDQNREYLIVGATHELHSNEWDSMDSPDVLPTYTGTVTAIDAQQPFRPPRVTPKPVVQGPQTATVVGKSGEEIWTDEFGRVKVQFHWDREGQADENSSCWIRVAQLAAGKGWGGIHIPRIGQEVIVEFLEGDPDRPIVTGRVYNGANRVPYELPGNQTISSMKSNSSKGGGGFNEIRFEDKKDEEQIFIHAQKDHHHRVENDELEWVGNERHVIVTLDHFEQLDGDKHLTITGDRNEKVDGTISRDATQDIQEKAGSNYAMDSGTEIHLNAGSNVVIEGGSQLTLKVGGSFVVVDSSGVAISGPQVLINSGGSAGSGSGSSPSPPDPPREPDTAEAGEVADTPEPPEPPEPIEFSPAAEVMQQAAVDGTPFCHL